MDLNALSIFVKVAEAGSFVGAARAADIPKSTVSRRIDELEAALGVRLLQRSTRKSELTDAGRSFYEHCRRIVEDVDDAVASVSEHQREPTGRLRFSTSVLLAERYVGRWAIEYMQAYPKVELDMYVAARKVDLLADGFDLVLRIGRFESSSHIGRRLAVAPSYLCASPAYLEAHGEPANLEDLRAHDAVLFSATRTREPWMLETMSGDCATISMASRLIVNSHPVAMDACMAGLGIAELPALIACDAVRDGRLRRVLPEWSNRSRWMHALYPSRAHVSATLRTFLDFLSDKLAPAPWDEEPARHP